MTNDQSPKKYGAGSGSAMGLAAVCATRAQFNIEMNDKSCYAHFLSKTVTALSLAANFLRCR